MTSINRGHRRLAELRDEAETRRQERTQRSPAEQLSLLDQRLGVGVGAKKERDQLASLLKEGATEKKTATRKRPQTESKTARSRERAKDRRSREKREGKRKRD
jgi:hypothetical protein